MMSHIGAGRKRVPGPENETSNNPILEMSHFPGPAPEWDISDDGDDAEEHEGFVPGVPEAVLLVRDHQYR